MLVVNMAMKQDDVIAVLEENGYKFVEKKYRQPMGHWKKKR